MRMIIIYIKFKDAMMQVLIDLGLDGEKYEQCNNDKNRSEPASLHALTRTTAPIDERFSLSR